MEIFDNLEQHLQRPQVLQSILSLMDRGTMVLTTNYDNLLEIFGQQQNRPMESLDLKDKTKVQAEGPGRERAGGKRLGGGVRSVCARGPQLSAPLHSETRHHLVRTVRQSLHRQPSAGLRPPSPELLGPLLSLPSVLLTWGFSSAFIH